MLTISIIVTLVLNKRKCNLNEMHKSATKIYSTQQTIYFIGGVHKSGTNLIKDILNQLPQVSAPKCSIPADVILGAGNFLVSNMLRCRTFRAGVTAPGDLSAFREYPFEMKLKLI